MMEPLALAVALIAGVDIRRVGFLAVALYLPVVVVGLVALAIWKTRRDAEARSALFCEGVASELRAGSPLREALSAAGASVGSHIPHRGSKQGSSIADVAEALAAEFEDVGTELEMTIRTAAKSGSQAADLFDEIGSVAIAQSEISHEVRVASSPARATAIVFVAVPVIYLVIQAQSGTLARLLAAPEQRIAGVAGLLLFVAGIVSAALLMWRAR
jgi:Flp pilus assembly protein TadB